MQTQEPKYNVRTKQKIREEHLFIKYKYIGKEKESEIFYISASVIEAVTSWYRHHR